MLMINKIFKVFLDFSVISEISNLICQQEKQNRIITQEERSTEILWFSFATTIPFQNGQFDSNPVQDG